MVQEAVDRYFLAHAVVGTFITVHEAEELSSTVHGVVEQYIMAQGEVDHLNMDPEVVGLWNNMVLVVEEL